jgi:hypothetical protein
MEIEVIVKMSEEVSEVKKEEIKISLKRCPLGALYYCDESCKWYVDGKCLMEILVVNLGCLVEVLNRMYFHEKYGGR